MHGAYLGPYYSDKEIMIMNNKYKAVYHKFDSQIDLTKKVANLIAKGNVIGWFQGRSEFGPRALGNRSILADPRDEQMQKKLNLKIKYREGSNHLPHQFLRKIMIVSLKATQKTHICF